MFFSPSYTPLFLLPVTAMMANMMRIKNTAIVAPIPQSCVTRKCCSIAVPSVITRFPAIKRVSMNSDKAGMKVTWMPDFTPSIVNGKITRVNVVHFDAPKSLAAAIKVGFNSFNELKIGKIMNGIKI